MMAWFELCRRRRTRPAASAEIIGTPDGVESTSCRSDPVVSTLADITQVTFSLSVTRESAQLAALTRPYDGAVTSTVTREGTAGSVVRRTVRTYQVRTYGCQMNVHDSERLAGLLE